MKSRYIILFSLLITFYQSFAQQDLVLYNMRYVPQRNYANPALWNNAKVNIGLPIISSYYFNLGNSGFKYSELVRKKANDSLYFDVENMVGKLAKNNYLFFNQNVDLLSFGFRVKEKSYFSVNITDRFDVRFRYPKDLIEFAWRGNGALLDKELLFNVGFDFSHYTEYGLNYSRKINDKLTVGARIKYLNGKENIQTKASDVRLLTDSKGFDITAQSNIIINTSGIADTSAFSNFDFIKYYFRRSNNGVAGDIGATYKFNDHFSISASANDIGYISWNAHVRNYVSKNANAKFTYQGIELNQFFNDSTSIDQAFEKVADSLANTFEIVEQQNAYKSGLGPRFYLGGNYTINPNHDIGLLVYARSFDKRLHPGVSLSYNLRLGRILGLSAAYSIYNRAYNNFGLGLSLNLGFMQWYLASDNLTGFIFPQNTKLAHIHAGFNMTFGRDKKDSDKDGLPDDKDQCPTTPGPKELNGCPDRDGDKIIDINDDCPDEAGLAEFKGCPDKDGDGLPDKEDECPEQAGPKDLKGCPDKDEDGIADKNDECPDVPGKAEFNGCPDKDGDNLPDHKDECPDEAGLLELNGCPDKDNDGVADKNDRCPEKPGPASNDGCPEVKLKLIDKDRNVVAVAIQNKDGLFVFEQLPSDETAMFIIEGEDTDNLKVVKVVGPSGVIKNAYKDENGVIYRFVPLKPEINKMQKEEAKDVVIKLNKEEEEILKKAFDNLEFETGKAIIRQSSYASLDELAELMKKKPSWRLKISGHTDNQGKPASNMLLSKNRANAVKDYLVKKGIDANRFKVEWFGQTRPIADNKTPEGRQKNRRVEMLIIE
ncbi:MAG: DUF5723 family protein [Bacteroidia bacterium]